MSAFLRSKERTSPPETKFIMISQKSKGQGTRDGTPQHPRSDVVRSEAFCNAFRIFEAGLGFFSSTATFRPQIGRADFLV